MPSLLLSESPDDGARIARVAAELLLCGPGGHRSGAVGNATPNPVDVTRGARRAIALQLAGVYCLGLKQLGIEKAKNDTLSRDLERAQRIEMANFILASRQVRKALQALYTAGIQVVALKGWSVAERLWPRPWMRPPGDLDVLVEEEALGDAIGVLARLGYQASPGDGPGRWRPSLAGVDMRRSGPGTSVDIHTRPFRTAGSGFAAREVFSRTLPGSVLGIPVRLLEPSDEILYLLIHAAKHGAVRTKWFLDLHAARLIHPREAWACAGERAIGCRATRPAWAAARLLGRRFPLSETANRAMRPPPLARLMLSNLVRCSDDDVPGLRARGVSYALEWLLEDRLEFRLKRLVGVIERLLPVGLKFSSRGRHAAAGGKKSDRWLSAVLRSGGGPMWATLRGSSMAPSIRPGDKILMAPFRPGETLREGDLLVAQRSGRLVAHRLVGRQGGKLVLRGDGASTNDPPIQESDILARIVGIRRESPDHRPANEEGGRQ